MAKNIYTTINLDNFRHNYKYITSLLDDGVKFCGLLKADAYGHGSVEIARFYESLGADYLCVARLEEAVELRQNGVNLPILLLGCCDDVDTLSNLDVEISVYNLEMAKALNLKNKKLREIISRSFNFTNE